MSRRRRAGGAAAGRGRDPLAPGATTLAEAARVLAAVRAGQSADAALAALGAIPDLRAVRAVALGAMRWTLRFLPALAQLLARPLAEAPPLLQALLLVAVHQLEHSRNPPESTAHRAVDAARALGLEHAAALVNAILRRFLRERVSLLATVDADLAVRSAHPEWLVAALQSAWPQSVEGILEANNAHPPLTLRVDLSRLSRADYLQRLQAAELPAHGSEWCPSAVIVERPVAVGRLPGFSEGLVSVQDAAAQLAAPLLDVAPGMRVLDACAAPGGKTGHLLETTHGDIELLAVDNDPQRLERVGENLRRLGREGEARCLRLDLRDGDALAELGHFDRILLDAPCSGTGVIRRHPDIKLLRRSSDLLGLAATQLAVLTTSFERLKPGGRILYATCSVLPAEGAGIVAEFLAREPRARLAPWPAAVRLPPAAIHGPFGLQLLPDSAAATDGFHYACIERATLASPDGRQ
jgi:16S rRNA (cytosine967-C5)-methyltransferase